MKKNDLNYIINYWLPEREHTTKLIGSQAIVKQSAAIVKQLAAIVKQSAMSSTIAASYDIIASYSHLYQDEIDEAVEEMGNFARTYDIMAEVRITIYQNFMKDWIYANFISTPDITMEDAMCKFMNTYGITEEEFVLFKK